MQKIDKPIVAIVGRPNVGKSTLFNRIIGRNLAVVHNRPGVTRDRIHADAEWEGKSFVIVDTGGLDLAPTDNLISRVKDQVNIALKEADAIIFMLDVAEGITPWDAEIAHLLKQSNKNIYVAVNKTDNLARFDYASEFYEIGIGEPFLISAIHGIGLNELLDKVISVLPEFKKVETTQKPIRIAVVGKPNVGKSSIVNAILGEERVIVDNIPGTTRDAINIVFHRNGVSFEIIDTAGMRRRRMVFDDLEKSSVEKAIQSILRSDVTWLVVDATDELSQQDKYIFSYIARHGKACILILNKWDIVEKDQNTFDNLTKEIRSDAPFMDYMPIISVSALDGLRVNKLLELTQIIFGEYQTRIPTHMLNEAFKDIVNQNEHPMVSGRRPSFKYITQVETGPPTFAIFTTYPELIQPHYHRYLTNQIRERFGFQGAPIKLKFLSNRSKRD